ncbi:PREDICTED: tumor necrosis factor receptor superfamily member 1A-like isoform X2 [Miniopterus natalensis]|uniref:tumor necrosis factor receptor superfamily member 1A-like isoform X2 n=1 Tax=Miniopterus natalensis TaxID=291302 RepID=UPI0007A6C7B8|nr:PREDICTED: tumor necrosis factor receptor superfamily member 1A-like isoform X2 [Miniopterus natalensis]
MCPAGSYVSAHCDVNHATQCDRCPSDTFMNHPNRETACRPVTECRGDQEMVVNYTRVSDRQCQCKSEIYYCDSEDCVENCSRCTSCPGATLQKCSATKDTVCAPEPGNPATNQASGCLSLPSIIGISIGVIAIIAIIVGIICYRNQGAQIFQRVVSYLKRSSEPGSPPNGSIQPSEDPERDSPAPGMETRPLLENGSALAPRAGTCPGPSEEPEEGIELEVVVAEGSQAAPEQVLQASALNVHGPQSLTKAPSSLRCLEQDYKQKYFLKDTSCDATNRLCDEFCHKVPESKWKMFMSLIGLEENDIEMCEQETPGRLMEQRREMLLRWRDTAGRDASLFTLMAAFHAMEPGECLQNIINVLVAENILGNHVEAPN